MINVKLFILVLTTDFILSMIITLKLNKTGCSAALVAHLLWEQRVAGSNPVIPIL